MSTDETSYISQLIMTPHKKGKKDPRNMIWKIYAVKTTFS
jgi:hypothetical protein